MFYINKAQLAGKVGKDIQIKTFDNGSMLGSFSLATSSFYKDKSGEKKESTQWHTITIKNENLLKAIENRVKKGADVYVEGELQYRKYKDANQIEKTFTEIVIAGNHGVIKISNKPSPESDNLFPNPKEVKKDPDEIPF